MKMESCFDSKLTMEEKFYKMLDGTNDINKNSFENNWPYILQATRNGLHIKESEDSIVYSTDRFSNDGSTVVVVNSLGPKRKDLVIKLAKEKTKSGKVVILKNIDKSEIEYWLKNNFEETTEPWSKYSFRDDNSFPQYNIFRKTIENFELGRYMRHQLRSFDKKRNIVTEIYNTENNALAKKLLSDFSKYSEAKGSDLSIEIERGHQFFFDESIKNKIRLQHLEGGRLVGFSFLTPVKENVYYNALICENESNLMKYLLYNSLKFVISIYPQSKIFGIQGSENKGQDFFKKRFRPAEIIEKTHLIHKS